MDGEEPIVWHEPILDAYWDQLKDTLSGDQLVTNIRDIHIENVEITKERIAALATLSGQVNKIEYILFNNVNLCEESIISMAKLVDVSSQLQTLFIHHNRIDNMESARCLSRSLRSHACISHLHTGINHLDLFHCDLGSNPEILSVLLHSDISFINLSNNHIDSLGAVKIAEYLESDPPIEHLSLAHNRFNDDDATLISQALKRNTNLRRIGLHTNNFTSIGVKALLTCVFDSSSLNTISKSNHALLEMNIYTYSRDNSWLQDCIDRLLLLDQKEKVMLALQDKDSLLQYLANVPFKLIPEVLAFTQRDGNQHLHRNLNVVYSTMRWWNMPMLYLYHMIVVSSDTKRKRDD
jgi:hypothetical protein